MSPCCALVADFPSISFQTQTFGRDNGFYFAFPVSIYSLSNPNIGLCTMASYQMLISIYSLSNSNQKPKFRRHGRRLTSFHLFLVKLKRARRKACLIIAGYFPSIPCQTKIISKSSAACLPKPCFPSIPCQTQTCRVCLCRRGGFGRLALFPSIPCQTQTRTPWAGFGFVCFLLSIYSLSNSNHLFTNLFSQASCLSIYSLSNSNLLTTTHGTPTSLLSIYSLSNSNTLRLWFPATNCCFHLFLVKLKLAPNQHRPL